MPPRILPGCSRGADECLPGAVSQDSEPRAGTARSRGPAACSARGSEGAPGDGSEPRTGPAFPRTTAGVSGQLPPGGLVVEPPIATEVSARWNRKRRDRSIPQASGPLRSRLPIHIAGGEEQESVAWASLAARKVSGGRRPPSSPAVAPAQAARRRRPEEAFFAARFRGAARRAGRSFFRLIVPRQPGAPQRHLTSSTSGSKR